MPGTRVFERVLLLVQQADGERDVAAVAHVAEEVVVELEEHGFQRGEVRDVRADEAARHCHDEACRDALAAGVADHHEQAVGVDLDEIVEVAADLLCSVIKIRLRVQYKRHLRIQNLLLGIGPRIMLIRQLIIHALLPL